MLVLCSSPTHRFVLFASLMCVFYFQFSQCSLCKEFSPIPERYNDPDKRKSLPELGNSVIDLSLDEGNFIHSLTSCNIFLVSLIGFFCFCRGWSVCVCGDC